MTVVPVNTIGGGIWPQQVQVSYPIARERTLVNTPAGQAGFPAARLSWPDGMSATAYAWWLGYTATSVVLSNLVLPDPETSTAVVHNHGAGNVTYLHHKEWTSALLWKIERGLGAASGWKNGQQWVGGPLVVNLTNLGGPA